MPAVKPIALMRRLVICGLVTVSICGTASADPRDVAKRNVALFDELVRCSKQPGFKAAGLGQGGPCAGWTSKIESQRTLDKELIVGGFLCLAGDIRIAGNSLVSGDAEHFSWVRKSVEECRTAIR